MIVEETACWDMPRMLVWKIEGKEAKINFDGDVCLHLSPLFIL